jgi:hypothetical protein
VVENNGGLGTGLCGEEGNAHSPPDIHYSKEPTKGKRLMRRSAPSQEPAGKTQTDAGENNTGAGAIRGFYERRAGLRGVLYTWQGGGL